MIIGTAGHIDHGKSALVAALTGPPMDRLAEERRRGITIDLNFAPLALGDGTRRPGSWTCRATRTSCAPWWPAPRASTSRCWSSPPTRASCRRPLEHLAVLEQLGVPAGIPVVTKADLVEPDWLELVLAEVAERLARLAGRVRAADGGVGPDRARASTSLRARLAAHAAAGSSPGPAPICSGCRWTGRSRSRAWGRSSPGPPGRGASPWATRSCCCPSGTPGRVRSIESYGADARAERARRAHRRRARRGRSATTAQRGTWLVAADAPWAAGAGPRRGAARSSPTRPARSTPRARVRVHLGTAEVMARVHPAGADRAGRDGDWPGSRWRSRWWPAAGDRFVLRSYSPVTTIGGGRVLDPSPPRRRSGLARAGSASEDPASALRGAARAPARRRARRRAADPAGPPAGRGGWRWPGPTPGARLVGELWVREATLARRSARAALSQLKALPPRPAQRPRACRSRRFGTAFARRTPLVERGAGRPCRGRAGSGVGDGVAALVRLRAPGRGRRCGDRSRRPHSGGGRA